MLKKIYNALMHVCLIYSALLAGWGLVRMFKELVKHFRKHPALD